MIVRARVRAVIIVVVVCARSADSAIFRLGHAETLLPVLSLLGLYRDDATLTSLRYHKLQSRAFRAGKLAPFGANIMFVLYKCGDDGDDVSGGGGDGGASYQVALLHNESPVPLPGCDDDGYLCPWDVFKQRYESIVNDCNFNRVCSISSGGKREEL